MGSMMLCKDCGKQTRRNSNGQKWCPKCSRKNIAANHKAARLRRKPTQGNGRGGKHNGGWKGGVSVKWAHKFKKSTCEVCATTERLEAHHVDENPRNNVEENIQTLCVPCHTKAHSRPRTCIDCNGTFVSGRRFKRCPPCKEAHLKVYRRKYYKSYERRT